MNKLDDLPAKYPRLFPEGGGSFQCNDGWYNLLDKLLGFIDWRLGRYQEVVQIRDGILARGEPVGDWITKYFETNQEDPRKHFRILQIKEKFGGLRFYWSCCDFDDYGEIAGAVSFAENLSFTICDVCGAPGRVGRAPGSPNWIRTLCDAHRAKDPVQKTPVEE